MCGPDSSNIVWSSYEKTPFETSDTSISLAASPAFWKKNRSWFKSEAEAIKDCKQADNEAVTPLKQPPEDTSTDMAPSSQPATEPAPPQSYSQQKAKEPVNSGVPKQQSGESDPSILPNQVEISLSPAAPSPSTSAPRHHETGALMVTKTTYVIPKKQPRPQPPSSHVSASASGQKSSSAPTLLNETRNLLVPPAPSAPSSRPSQPNNQVRQSIQRSLSSILFKRVCDCEDLEMSESEVAKVVASIEMEMFDIFRNTDSKYMNKYRTIMFNLKDPRNKGLLCCVVRGEISPFRLARMSQKDMQATKASEPSAKETTEVKDAAAKALSLLQKPEAVKVDLPSLNPARPDRNMVASQEQKKSFPAPALKTRISQGRAVPDILACMLKDTTSEHKAHLFDLKCKICTGQILAGEEEEPAKKKPKVSETSDKQELSWRRSAGDDSPLRAPPDSPDMDSPTSSRLIIDAPELTIVESPASPIMDSPASPTLESPASPVMESPASPTPDTPITTTQRRAYTPVVIPAVSTVTITRRDPRTAASRFSPLSGVTSGPSDTTHNPSVPYAPFKESISASPSAPASSQPPTKPLPKSILMKPSSSVDPRLYSTSSRTVISESPADGETSQFLAKQDIVWKGFLNMLTVAKFVTKGYLVSGSAENLKADLPDTIQIGGRILPQTVWDYVAKLKSSVTKELCVIRFHPATEEEEVAYVSLFSYFSSRGRFGVVANGSRSIKDVYLVPLSSKESIPSILQPLNGPGLERNRPNLLLGLAVIQKAKRPGCLPQEIEEKRPKVHMSKDPMWIPKPPVLYGSDKLEIFQPYDPETPASTTPPSSPPCPGSPSDSSSSGSVIIPSPLTSFRTDTPVTTSAPQLTSNSISDKNPTTASGDKTPLQTILKSLFGNKQTDSAVSSDGSSTTTTTTTTVGVKKVPMFSQTRSMVDPIVEQFGQKSKVKKIEEEENDFDRPYDPEEEYDPAMGYGMVAPQSIEQIKADGPAVTGFSDDGVAYDPEDETIFADIQSDIVVTKPPVPTQTSSSPSCPAPVPIQIVTPAPTSTPPLTSTPAEVRQNIPTGTVVVSAATLTEQQRMLEELNKQIEEQKRQLKEQEEALRQQREAVGMFMAHFSVSDSLMSPPQKSLPVSQLSESTDKTSNLTETVDSLNVESQAVKLEDTTAILNLENDADNVTDQDEMQENVKESSAGEIEDSDVAYDPEDESLFNEIQDDVFQGGSIKTQDSSLSRTGHSASQKGTPLNAYHSRKRRLSPKKRSHRERDHHRSPSRRSQRRSPSHSRRRRERDRHRRSERDRSRHRARNQSERQGHHSKGHSTHRHSHGRRRSPSSTGKKDSGSLSPKQHREPSPQVLEKSKPLSVLSNAPDSVVGQFVESNTSLFTSVKNNPDGNQLKSNLDESIDKGFSPRSHSLLHNVKLETSEPPKSQELKTTSVGDHDDSCSGSSTQVDKPSQQETLFSNKFESTVPLRVIDPPIRDSPQSPDPDPQFVNPSSIGIDSVKIEEIRVPEMHTSVSMTHVKIENNVLPICGQATMSNIFWPTVGGPISNVGNMDFRTLNLQSSGVSDTGMIEEDKRIEGGSPSLKHQTILGHGGGHSDPATNSDIQRSAPKIDPVTKRPGPGISDPGIKNAGSHMKELEHGRPQIDLREKGIRFPGHDMRGTGMQGISPNICPGSDTQDLAIISRGEHVRDPGTRMQGSEADFREPVVQQHNSDRIGSLPVIRGSGMRSPVRNMQSSSMPGVNQEVKGSGPYFRHSKLEVRGKMLVTAVANSHMGGSGLQNERGDPVMKGPPSYRPGPDTRGTRDPLSTMYHPSSENADVRPGVMEIRRDQSFGGPQIEGRAPDIIGRGQKDRGESPHTGGMRSAMRGGGVRDPSLGPSFRGSGRVQMQSKQDGSPVSSSGPREHFNEPLPNTRTERMVNGPDMTEAETMHNLRRPDLTEISYMGPSQDMDSTGGSDTRGDGMLNITNQDWRGPGPGFVGPDMRGQRSHNKSLIPHIRGPDWRGLGSEIRDVWKGPDMKGSGPVRGRPFIQDEWRVNQYDKSCPNIENQGHDTMDAADLDFREPGSEMSGHLKHDKRRPGGQDFMTPGPVMRRPDMEVPMHDRQGPRGPDLMRPEPEWSSPIMGNLGPGMQGPGGPGFAGPGLERRDLALEGPGSNSRGPVDPDFSGAGPDRKGPTMEAQVPHMRGPAGPDFKVTWPERRGPGGPDFRGPGPERIGPAMEGPATDMRGLGGLEFSDLGPERRALTMGGPGHVRRGPGGLDFRGPGPERRGPGMEGPVPDRRGPGGPNFRGPGPERRGPGMEGPGPDRRGPGDPDFSEPGPERRGLSMKGPGPARRGPGGLDFRGQGPEMRCSVMEGPEPVRREPEGPDFRGPGPESRDLSKKGLGPDRRGPGGPDFRGLGPERQGPAMEGPGPEWRGPNMEGPGPDRRGLGSPDLGPPGPERRGPVMEGPGRNRRRAAGPDFRGPGPERRGPVIEGPGPERREPGGPDFMGPGPASRDFSMQGPGPDRRGPGGPDFRGLGPERRGPAMEGPGPEWRGPDMEGPGLDRKVPGGPDFRGPGPESRGVLIEGPGPDRRGPGGPEFRGPGPEGRSLSVRRHEPDSRHYGIPDFRGAGHERRGPAMEAPGPDRREPGGPDFSGPGPHRRASAISGSGPDRTEIEVLDFQGQGSERGGHTMNNQEPDSRAPDPDGPDFRGPGCKRRGPYVKGQGPDRRGPGNQNTYFMGPGSDFTGLGPERTGSGIEGPGPHSREQGRPHFRGPGPRSGQTNIEGPGPDTGGPDIRGPRPERPGSRMQGPVPNRRVPGGPDIRRTGHQHSGPNREGPGPDRRTPEIEGTGNSRSFPEGPLFRGPETDRRPPDREGPESDRRGPHFRDMRPEITVMEGPGLDRKHPRGPDFRGPGCLSRGPDIEGSWPGRQEPGSSGFRVHRPERRGPDMEGPEPEWRKSGGPDFRGPGVRHNAPNTEGLRQRRDDWEGADFRGSELIQESPVIEGQVPETGQNLRCPRPTRGNRGPGPNFRGSTPDRRGTDTEQQWSEGTGPNMEALGNERDCSRDDWKIHGNRGPGPIQVGPGQQVQEQSRQGPHREWRGPENRGPRPLQERPTMPFPGPLRAPEDDWSGPGVRGPGPVQGDPDMVCPGPGRERPGNGWNEPDRGDAGPNRRGPGPNFSGPRDPDNRRQGLNRRGLGMTEPGSDTRGGPDMGNDWRQPNFRGNMRGTNMEGPGARSGAPDSMNFPSRRGIEMEGIDRRVPRGPDFRQQETENRNSNIESPGTDGRLSNFGGLGSERQGVDMESPETCRQGFEHDFKRKRRGPDIRRLGPGKTDRGPAPESSDLRYGPGRWDTNTEGPGSDRRGPDMMGRGLDSRGYEPAMKDDTEGSDKRGPGCDGRGLNMTASPHFNITQINRCQGPSDPNSAPCKGPLGQAQNRGGNSCPGFDNLQNHQAVKPHRHRAALLPTPTEGLIRFPNRMINNPDVLSLKRKQIGHPTDREWSRGRQVSRERELVKGQRQEQEKSPAGRISTPVDANTEDAEGKKEVGNKTDKQGVCVETKTKQIMDSDENKSNAQPS